MKFSVKRNDLCEILKYIIDNNEKNKCFFSDYIEIRINEDYIVTFTSYDMECCSTYKLKACTVMEKGSIVGYLYKLYEGVKNFPDDEIICMIDDTRDNIVLMSDNNTAKINCTEYDDLEELIG